jgi:serine/threonine protein kinase
LHSNDIVHRDIKPSNFLLNKDEKGRIVVKLSDFDLAKKVSLETHKDTLKD